MDKDIEQTEATEKWFISDTRINKVSEDAFSHIDYARELKAKIIELPTPLTIALAGEHGTGKSSIGVLLEKQFEKDPHFEFVRIEAWRHEGESRRKAFLHDVVEGLIERFSDDSKKSSELVKVKDELYSSHARQTAVLDLTSAKDSIRVIWDTVNKRSIWIAAAAGIITVLVLVVFYFCTVRVSPALAGTVLWSVFSATFSLPFVVGIGGYFSSLVKQLSEKVLEPAKITVTTNPPSSAEQYEQVFRRTLRIALRNGNETKTMVLFVDELDRLPPNEIIDALRAIRTFREVEPCVFVVGLDEDIVRRALVESKVGAGLVEDSVEAEEFLNKFFKLRQHIPVLVSRDMREFARELVSEGPRRRISAGIAGLEADETSDVLDALIHRLVKTPRHAIRLLNACNSDYRLASVREGSENGLLSRGSISGHLPFLAVITVLREDYPDFYAELTRNQDLVFAIDMFQEGKSPAEVDKAFPTYSEVCAPYYFREKTQPVSDKPAIDYSDPNPKYRDLFLYLRNTDKFRAPSLVPFIYLREDQAARVLGSRIKEEMADEFQANATNSLRNRIETGNVSYATAAAQVALICLDDSRGTQLENALLATCNLLDLLDEGNQSAVANKIVQRGIQNKAVIKRVAPRDFLNALRMAAPSPSVDACIRTLVERLNPEDVDPGRAVFDELVGAFDLVAGHVELSSVQSYAAALASHLPLSDLDDLVATLNRNNVSPDVLDGFFGLPFLEALSEAASSAEYELYPPDFPLHIEGFYQSIQMPALANWKSGFLGSATMLLNARSWDLHETGFAILRNNKLDLTEASAKLALETLLKPGNAAGAKDVIDRHEQLQVFLIDLVAQFGKRLVENDNLPKDISAYLASALGSENQEVRFSLRNFLKKLSPLLADGYFDDFIATTIGVVPTLVPKPEAFDALQTLASLGPQVTEPEIKPLYDSLSLPVRQLANSSEAAFGADALIAALEGEANSARKVAEGYLPGLVALIAANQSPSNLVQVSRVLDASVLCSDVHIATYITNLESFMRVSTPLNISFAISRLKPLIAAGKVAESSRGGLVQAIVTVWEYIPSEMKEFTTQLLFDWRSNMPEGSRSTFWKQQADQISVYPEGSWNNLSAFWLQMPTTVRANVLVSAMQQASISHFISKDLSDTGHRLSPDEVSDLIAAMETEIDATGLQRITSTLTALLNEQECDMVSTKLFTMLRQQPEKLNHQAMTSIASSLAASVHDEGFAYYVELLQGDQALRTYGINNLSSFLDRKKMSSAQAERLSSALAIEQSDPNDWKNLSVKIAVDHGVHTSPHYKASLERERQHLTGSKDDTDKQLLKSIRAALRK